MPLLMPVAVAIAVSYTRYSLLVLVQMYSAYSFMYGDVNCIQILSQRSKYF